MKKLGTLAIALTLTASLGATALASELDYGSATMPISPRPSTYNAILTVNGETLDTAGLPAVSGAGMLPMRLVAEADHGSAYWSQEENTGSFYLDGNQITVHFADNSVLVNDEAVQGVAVQVAQGVTYLSADVLNGLEGYSVNTDPELGVNRLDVITPNNDPMLKLSYQLMETAGMGFGMKATAAELEEYYGIHAGNFTQAVGFFSVNTSPDTLILGKLSDGKLDALKAELEAYRQGQEDTFSWYLSQNLPKVQAAQVAVSGDWVLFVIADNADAAVAQFEAAAKEL